MQKAKLSRKMNRGPKADAVVLAPRNSPTNNGMEMKYNPKETESVAVTKCLHCENMAKNFLYLESLIRSHYNEDCTCKTCSSSLKYLEFVNKNIKKYFGDFDAVVEAAKVFRPYKISAAAQSAALAAAKASGKVAPKAPVTTKSKPQAKVKGKTAAAPKTNNKQNNQKTVNKKIIVKKARIVKKAPPKRQSNKGRSQIQNVVKRILGKK